MKKKETPFKNIESKKTISVENIEKENAILFQALCDNSLTGVFILNENKLQYCNKAFNEIFGYEKDELIGVSPEELVIPEDHGILKEKNSLRISGKASSIKYEIRGRKKNGEIVYLMIFGTIAKIENRILLIGNLIDISQREQLDLKINEYKNNLEQKIIERTDELFKVNKSLDKEISERKHVEDELFENQIKYRTLIDQSTSIILELDTEGIILFINSFGQKFFDFKYEEIVGKNIVGTIVEEVDSTGYDLKTKLSIVQKNPDRFYSSENENVKKNGEKVWIAWTNNGIYSSEGKLIKTICFGIDRSEQKKAEIQLNKQYIQLQNEIARRKEIEAELEQRVFERTEELIKTNKSLNDEIELNKKIQDDLIEKESRLQLAAQSAQLGVWEWNIENGDNTWSDRIYELLGIDKSEKINIDSLTDLIHPDDKEKFKQANLLALEGNGKYDIIVRIFRSDGNIVYVRSNATVIRNDKGDPIRMIGNCRDITEEINSENELIAAKERAEESDRLKSSFLRNMNHEVRTPLNSIIGFSKLIARPDNSKEDIEDYSYQIKENTEKLIAIIDDIIEISKIYAGQVQTKLTSFNFTQLIKDIVYEHNYKAIEKDIKLYLTIEMPSNEYILNSDKEKIEEILNHIIDNSVKFTFNGGVKINCKVNNKNLEISIVDTGIGIPENMQQIVFEPFRQVECGITRKYGGNGLGLTLAKAHAGLLNGSITLESELNKGTKVMISLPIKD